jgi:hypothetical protein
MNALSGEDFEKGLDEYDVEQRVFPAISERVEGGAPLAKWELLQILKWKLGRITDANSQTVSDENLRRINLAITVAREPDGGLRSIEMLDRVPGIGLATATAILSICHPNLFTILDWRVLETLQFFPSAVEEASSREPRVDDWTAKTYMAVFLPTVRKQSLLWGCSLRNADRALWGLSVRRRITELIDGSEP